MRRYRTFVSFSTAVVAALWRKKYGDKSGRVFCPDEKCSKGCRGVARRYRSRCDFTGWTFTLFDEAETRVFPAGCKYHFPIMRKSSGIPCRFVLSVARCGHRYVRFACSGTLSFHPLWNPPPPPSLQVSWNAHQHALDFTDNDIRNERFRYCQHSDRILLHVDRWLYPIDLILIGSKEKEREKKKSFFYFIDETDFYFKDLDGYVSLYETCDITKMVNNYIFLIKQNWASDHSII